MLRCPREIGIYQQLRPLIGHGYRRRFDRWCRSGWVGLHSFAITKPNPALMISDRLMLANCFNHSQISYRVIEKRSTLTTAGQADGIKCLTMEMLNSVGVGDLLERVACRVDEQVVWNPDGAGNIKRDRIIPDVVAGTKTPREYTLSQG